MPNLKHVFVSPKVDGGDATLVRPSDWNAEHVVDNYLTFPATTGTVPASGDYALRLHAGRVAGQMFLEFSDPSGDDVSLQSSLAFINYGMYLPQLTTTIATVGLPTVQTTGTISTPAISVSTLRTQMRRFTSTTGTGTYTGAGIRSNVAVAWRGNAAGQGGFLLAGRIGMSAVQATKTNAFFGLRSTVGVITAGTQPSTLTTFVGFGFDREQTTWRIMWGSGTGGTQDLGGGFPVDTSTVYDMLVGCPPNSSGIHYQIDNLSTGSGTYGFLNTNLLANNQLLSIHVYVSVTGTTPAAMDCARVYLESDV
jgi:hypothetical protein